MRRMIVFFGVNDGERESGVTPLLADRRQHPNSLVAKFEGGLLDLAVDDRVVAFASKPVDAGSH